MSDKYLDPEYEAVAEASGAVLDDTDDKIKTDFDFKDGDGNLIRWVGQIRYKSTDQGKTWQVAPLKSILSGGTSGGQTSFGYGSTAANVCTHEPTHVITYKGLDVYVGREMDCDDHMSEYSLTLNLTGRPASREHIIPVASLKKWEKFNQPTEIVLDWPDYGIIPFPLAFWEELAEAAKAEGGSLLMFCVGGHGRTGTALAAMLIAVLGYSANEAIQWIRKNYCDKAVESKPQEAYIRSLWQQYRRQHKVEERDLPEQRPERKEKKKFWQNKHK